jgi:hypothetical protein
MRRKSIKEIHNIEPGATWEAEIGRTAFEASPGK